MVAPAEHGPEALLQRYKETLRGQYARSENTVRVYTADLRPFVTFLRNDNMGLGELDRRHLRRYLAWLATSARGEGGGYARVSVARKLGRLRAFYRFLVQEGVVNSNPIPSGRAFSIKIERRLPVFLGMEEVERLLAAPDTSQLIGKRDRAILELLYSTGTRLSELRAIDISDVNLEAGEVTVLGKGSKERVVLLGKPAAKAIAIYMNSARPQLENASPTGPRGRMEGSYALFLNRYGGRLSGRSIEKLVSRYAIAAATRPGVHPHTLRHTFATHFINGGGDLRVVQELLGHSSPATTQLYTHITRNEAHAEYMTTHPRARLKPPPDESRREQDG